MDLPSCAILCYGIQEWLPSSFKSPQHAPAVYPEHDAVYPFRPILKNTLIAERWARTGSPRRGIEYYDESRYSWLAQTLTCQPDPLALMAVQALVLSVNTAEHTSAKP